MIKRRTREQWRALIAEQASSGLNAAAFCRERGINPKYFSKRKHDLVERNTSEDGDTAQSAFVQVMPVSSRNKSVGMLQLRVGEAVLVLPAGVPARWLGELLRTVGGATSA